MNAFDIIKEVKPILAMAKMPMADRSMFVEHLRIVYHIIRASYPLLKMAIATSRHGSALYGFFFKHAEEEQGHDVWLRNDLNAAGFEIGECPLVASQLAGSMYYHLKHTSCVALLGYMLVLEGFPMPLSMVEVLEKVHGKTLLRTVRHHAEEDPGHRDEIITIVNSLSENEVRLVRKIAIETAFQIVVIVNSIQGAERGQLYS